MLAIQLVAGQYGPPLQGIQWDYNYNAAPQYQYQQQAPMLQQPQQQQYEAMGADREEPMVGSSLLGPKFDLDMFKLKTFGVPGLRFNNFQAGRVGPLHFAHSILGAENPNAADDDENRAATFPELGSAQQNYQQYQAEPQVAAPLYYPHSYESEPQVAAPPQNPEFHHWWHFANPDEQQQNPTLAAPPQYPQHYQQQYQYEPLAAPPQFNNYQQSQVASGPVVQPMDSYSADAQANDNERSWDWKKG